MLMLYLSYFSEAHPEGITISNYKKNQETPTRQSNYGIYSKLYYFLHWLSCAGTSYRCKSLCLTLKSKYGKNNCTNNQCN